MLSIFFIGLALSMDAFSLSISAGTTNLNQQKKLVLATSIAVTHFLMPLLGVYIGYKIFQIIPLSISIFNVIIFIYLGTVMLLKKEDTKIFKYSLINTFILAICVSIDSFSVGLGLSGMTRHYLLASLIFGVISGIVSYIGLILGERIIGLLKEHATKLGALILFLLAIVNLMKELIRFN